MHLTNQPSCSCSDFNEYGSWTMCKHILFVLMFGHDINDVEFLKKVTFTDEELIKILATKLNKDVVREKDKKTRSRKEEVEEAKRAREKRDAILRNNSHFNDQQVVSLRIKTEKSVKCTGRYCKKVINIGDTCLQVDGCISIPFGSSNYAEKQSKWFCPLIGCLSKPHVWTNVKLPTEIKKCDLVSDAVHTLLVNDLKKLTLIAQNCNVIS